MFRQDTFDCSLEPPGNLHFFLGTFALCLENCKARQREKLSQAAGGKFSLIIMIRGSNQQKCNCGGRSRKIWQSFHSDEFTLPNNVQLRSWKLDKLFTWMSPLLQKAANITFHHFYMVIHWWQLSIQYLLDCWCRNICKICCYSGGASNKFTDLLRVNGQAMLIQSASNVLLLLFMRTNFMF